MSKYIDTNSKRPPSNNLFFSANETGGLLGICFLGKVFGGLHGGETGCFVMAAYPIGRTPHCTKSAPRVVLTEDTVNDFGGYDAGEFLVEPLKAESEAVVIHA
jgi:hypothetical protein